MADIAPDKPPEQEDAGDGPHIVAGRLGLLRSLAWLPASHSTPCRGLHSCRHAASRPAPVSTRSSLSPATGAKGYVLHCAEAYALQTCHGAVHCCVQLSRPTILVAECMPTCSGNQCCAGQVHSGSIWCLISRSRPTPFTELSLAAKSSSQDPAPAELISDRSPTCDLFSLRVTPSWSGHCNSAVYCFLKADS